MVVDHCLKNLAKLYKLEDNEAESGSMAWLKMIRNHEKKMAEWLVSFGSDAELSVWLKEGLRGSCNETPPLEPFQDVQLMTDMDLDYLYACKMEVQFGIENELTNVPFPFETIEFSNLVHCST